MPLSAFCWSKYTNKKESVLVCVCVCVCVCVWGGGVTKVRLYRDPRLKAWSHWPLFRSFLPSKSSHLNRNTCNLAQVWKILPHRFYSRFKLIMKICNRKLLFWKCELHASLHYRQYSVSISTIIVISSGPHDLVVFLDIGHPLGLGRWWFEGMCPPSAEIQSYQPNVLYFPCNVVLHDVSS